LCMKKNEIILSFGIFDFNDISHDEISEFLGIQPEKIRVKGEKKNPKNPDSSLITKNIWSMGSGLDKYTNFDDQMDSLLSIIESKIDLFKVICSKYHCEISCAIFVYFDNGESAPWVHLDSRYNQLIKDLNIEFDVDLYVLRNSGS